MLASLERELAEGAGEFVRHRGGPFDGKQFVLYRARQYYTPRVSRGTLRRALRMSRRYAWYELGLAWEEDEVLHGEYDFLNIRAESEPLERTL